MGSEAGEDAALVLQQKRWRWLPIGSTQRWQAWSPFQHLPAVRNLGRLSARCKAPERPASRDSRAILQDEASKCFRPAEPLKLDIGSSDIPVAEDLEEGEASFVRPGSSFRQSSAARKFHPFETLKLSNHQPCMAAESCIKEQEDSPEVERAIVHTATTNDSSEEVDAPVVLDVGFAQVELKRFERWPKYNFYITATDGLLTRDGAEALLDYLEFVLHMPDVMLTGFILTYDVRSCLCPQLDLVSEIIHFISDPQREQVWHERCVCWKVLVPSGVYFKVAQSVLSLLFAVSPPKCRVFLSTDVDTTKAEEWICYKPEELADTNFGMLSSLGSGFLEMFPSPADVFFLAQDETLEGCAIPACVSASQEAMPVPPEDAELFYDANEGEDSWEDPVTDVEKVVEEEDIWEDPVTDVEKAFECAESLTTPFALISQGFNYEAGMGFLTLQGRAAPVTDEGLQQIMSFMDDFVNSANAQKGYSITYDFRVHGGIPSMSTVMQVAEWGSQKDRQAKWNLLNKSCKIVIPPGWTHAVCKGLLKSFFYVCPPVCRTLLVTDPDELDQSAAVFEPVESNNKIEAHLTNEEPDPTSDDDRSSCGPSENTSETTAASPCGGMSRTSETLEDDRWQALCEKLDAQLVVATTVSGSSPTCPPHPPVSESPPCGGMSQTSESYVSLEDDWWQAICEKLDTQLVYTTVSNSSPPCPPHPPVSESPPCGGTSQTSESLEDDWWQALCEKFDTQLVVDTTVSNSSPPCPPASESPYSLHEYFGLPSRILAPETW